MGTDEITIRARGLRLVRTHWMVVALAAVALLAEVFGQQLSIHLQKYYVTPSIGSVPSSLAVRGMPRSRQDEVLYYTQAVRMFDGVFSGDTGDAFVREYSTTPRPLPALTFLGIGAFGRMIGDVDVAFRLLKAMAMLLTLVAAYGVVYLATRGTLSAITAASVVAWFPRVGELLHLAARGAVRIVGLADLAGDPLTAIPTHVFRVPFTGLTQCMLLAGVVAIAWSIRSPSAKSIVVAGVAIGVQAYVYPYHLTTFALGLPVLLLWYGATRDWRAARAILLAGALGAVLMAPALLHQWEVSSLPSYGDYVMAVGTVTRQFDAQAIPVLLVLAALWAAGWLLGGAWRGTYVTTLSLAAGAALSLNLHVVTGAEIQRWHWMEYIIYPLTALAVCLLSAMAARRAVVLRSRYAAWRKAAPVMAAALVVFVGTRVVESRVMYAEAYAPRAFLPADHVAAYRWLSEQVAGSSVVALGSEQIRLLPLMAGCYGYLPMGAVSPAPFGETVDRWIAACRFYGMSAERFGDLVRGDTSRTLYNTLPPEASREGAPWLFESTTIHEVLFHKRFRSARSLAVAYSFPDSVQRQLLASFAAMSSPDSALRAFRADYVWQGPYERAVGIDSLEACRNVERVFERGRVRIYLLR